MNTPGNSASAIMAAMVIRRCWRALVVGALWFVAGCVEDRFYCSRALSCDDAGSEGAVDSTTSASSAPAKNAVDAGSAYAPETGTPSGTTPDEPEAGHSDQPGHEETAFVSSTLADDARVAIDVLDASIQADAESPVDSNEPTAGPRELLPEGDAPDANAPADDSCEGDCVASCHEGQDCDDGDICNGKELCESSGVCVPGTQLECDDHVPCTVDGCDAVAGCQHSLNDGDGDGFASSSLGACGSDCNDNNATIYVGAAEACDGVDNNCNGVADDLAPTWYLDCDGDGFAPDNPTKVQQCDEPTDAPGCPPESDPRWLLTGPVAGMTDCYDANHLVYPPTEEDNADAFSQAKIEGRSLSADFDYNCDTVEEKLFKFTAADIECTAIATGIEGQWACVGPSGGGPENQFAWETSVAACGVSKTLLMCPSAVTDPDDCVDLVNVGSEKQYCR